MRIKIIEPDGYQHQGNTLEAGNTYTVDTVTGEALCFAGMAEDADGNIETGERDVNKRVIINIDNSDHSQSAEDA